MTSSTNRRILRRSLFQRPAMRGLALLLAWVTAAAPLAAQEQERGPVIRHKAVTAAVRGRPLGITALVTSQDAPVKRVTLYYTRSREASPSKVTMVNTSGSSYLGTLPSYHLTSGDVMWYYIEAIGGNDQWSETSWQRITLVDSAKAAQPAGSPTATPVKVEATPARSGPSTKTIVIGGAVVAGAAIAIAAAASSGGGDSGGGGGGGSGDTSSNACSINDAVGSWVGNNPSVAPGFLLNRNFTAIFLEPGGGSDSGVWGLTDCVVTLSPNSPSNDVYRGSGNLSGDRRSLTINGNTYSR